MTFLNRIEAGRLLARRLAREGGPDTRVVALPCAGAVVAYEVARELSLPLELLVVRKVHAPGAPAAVLGALAEGGEVVLDRARVDGLGIDDRALEALLASERAELSHCVSRVRAEQPLPDLRGRVALLVDEGAASGRRAVAAARTLRRMGARRVVVAVPVIQPEAIDRLRGEADDLVYLDAPADFIGIGYWYSASEPVTEEDVLDLLARARRERPAAPAMAP